MLKIISPTILLLLFFSCDLQKNKTSVNKEETDSIDSTIVVCDNFRGYKKISYHNYIVFESLIDFSRKHGVFVYNLKDSFVSIKVQIEDRKDCMIAPTICTDIRPIVVKDDVIVPCNTIIYKPLSGILKISKKQNVVKMILEDVIWYNSVKKTKIDTQVDTLIFKLSDEYESNSNKVY